MRRLTAVQAPVELHDTLTAGAPVQAVDVLCGHPDSRPFLPNLGAWRSPT